ncbi:hypothetical protein [Streptomyces sp. Ru73]|uniref:hypothetical protein n=1 Tax=Streptomyces sp. Ru73 TaxID=2080748 RepID=UPI0021565737|nr:hypothetical protein [Streptomyces sp. Ru73]
MHVREDELTAAAAEAPSRRYRPAHWAHGPRWETYGAGGDTWAGFTGVRELAGLGPDFLLVPLGGHSAGHAGIAVRDGERWLLHAGDAYFYHREIAPEDPSSHPLLDLIQLDAQVDAGLRIANQRRLAGAAREEGITVVNAHDPWVFSRLAG